MERLRVERVAVRLELRLAHELAELGDGQLAGPASLEHALLEDGGDGEGSLDPAADGKDGRIASILTLGEPAAQDLPADPKLRQLYEDRRELERRVEGLKLLKGNMDPAKYAADLERLLTDLALKTQQIRAIEGKK